MDKARSEDPKMLEKLKSETSVLIVDDEKPIVRTLKKYLEMEKYKVITASSAEEGFQLYQNYSPRIILIDIQLPGVSGIELLDLIRSKDQNTEIIIISGHGTMDTAVEAMRRQASDFLTKPIELDALGQTVLRSLRRLAKKNLISDDCSILEKEIRQLRERAAYLEEKLRRTPNAVMTYDRNGRISSLNEEAVRITGYTQEESIGKMVSELFITSGPLLQAEDMDTNNGERRNVIGQVLTKEQQIRYFNRNANILRSNSGQPIGGIESFWDVTEQVNNDRLLEKRYLQVQTINEIGKLVAASTDLSQVMDFVCQRLFQTFFESSQIGIFLREESKGMFVLKSLAGYNIDRVLKNYPIGTTFERDTGIICEAAKKGQPLIVNDLSKDSSRKAQLMDKATSVFVYPIHSANYIAGILNIENIERVDLDESDRFMLEAVAEYLGISIERIGLMTKITEQNKLLERQAKDLKKALRKVESQKQIIEQQNEQMIKELKKAGEFQLSLLPEVLPAYDDVRFAADFHPSSQLGGDFYDILELDGHLIGILVADASGHGPTAAMLSAMFKMSFEKYAPESKNPAEVFEKLNQDFCKVLQMGEFFTAFYVVYDRVRRKLYYSNAAHPRALLYDYTKKNISELDTDGFLLGVMEQGITYEYKEMIMPERTRLLIYTDGINEAMNEQHKMYGHQRIKDQLVSYADAEAPDFIRAVKEDLVQYTKSDVFNDDVTIVVMDLQQ
ncbi:MAG TPA: response regulator [Caldithrix abyssi]|uniref:Response regulator n=1 Tax=Caldithrix abyssi TaxID=187145 RepID=A0A7V4U0R7_CALAY|nr:response regulator [Caldithrix abyssi]